MTATADNPILSAAAALRNALVAWRDGRQPLPEDMDQLRAFGDHLCAAGEQHFADNPMVVSNYCLSKSYREFLATRPELRKRKRRPRLEAFGEYIGEFQSLHWKPYRADEQPNLDNRLKQWLYNAHVTRRNRDGDYMRIPTGVDQLAEIVGPDPF